MKTDKIAEPKGYVVNSILDVNPDALREIKSHLEMQNFAIPVSQIIGFSQFVANAAPTISTVETTASTSYTDLATEGPTLSGLPSGQYLVFFGFTGSNTVAGAATIMSISIDGAVIASDVTPGITMTSNAKDSSVLGFFITSVTGDRVGGHEFKAKYKVDGGTGTFFYRRLAAFKFAN